MEVRDRGFFYRPTQKGNKIQKMTSWVPCFSPPPKDNQFDSSKTLIGVLFMGEGGNTNEKCFFKKKKRSGIVEI
jgi:hypothetical protein